MRALVVYESMFGNTREVAEAITEGLHTHMSIPAPHAHRCGRRGGGATCGRSDRFGCLSTVHP